MDFVDKEHVAFFQGREQTGEFARFFDHGTARVLNVYAHRVRNDVGERGFAQARRAAEQNVLEDVVTFLGRGHHQFQTFPDFYLTGELVEGRRAQRDFESGIGLRWVYLAINTVV